MEPIQIALTAAQIAGTLWPIFEPLAAKGLSAFIAELHTLHPSATKEQIKAVADKHGVNLKRVFDVAAPSIMHEASAAHPALPAGHMGFGFSDFFASFASAFTSLRNWLADPKTAAAIANVEDVAVALICEISSAAGLAATVMQEVNAGQSVQGTNQKVYVATASICSALKGTLTGQQANNVPAIVSVN